MAKGGKSGKRIPKSIAGVKVPKELRKAGEKLLDKAQRPETQAKIAGVLTMAAGAIAAAAQKRGTAQSPTPPTPPVPPVPPVPPIPPVPPVPPHPDVARGPGAAGIGDVNAVGDMVGEIVGGVMERLFGGQKPRRDPPG